MIREVEMFKISGLEKLSKELQEAQTALKSIDGEIGSVRFDPSDPASIEGAIIDTERIIDEKLGNYSSNKIVAPLIDSLKEQYRQGILNRAMEARLEGNTD